MQEKKSLVILAVGVLIEIYSWKIQKRDSEFTDKTTLSKEEVIMNEDITKARKLLVENGYVVKSGRILWNKI